MTLVGESWPAWHGALRNVEWPEGDLIYIRKTAGITY